MPSKSSHNSTDEILARCRSAGFGEAGIARAEPIAYERELVDWLEAKKHGEMSYLAKYVEQRIDPRRMFAGCRSMIVVADRYAGGAADELVRRQGRIARYARGGDYHKSMKKRLRQLCDELQAEYPAEFFRAAVDTAPVMEREHAARAGLGSVGKHTLLLDPGVGSYFFIGEILTTLELTPHAEPRTDHCGTCTRCLEACPTEALTPYALDATRCISYLTIEHRSLIDEEFHREMGDWVFGCDICQEVCPHNGETIATQAAEVSAVYEARRRGFDLLEILNWDEEDRRREFSGSALKRAKLEMFKRNALIAAGNFLEDQDDVELQKRISELADDADASDLIRTTAGQIRERLGGDFRAD